MEFLRSFLRRHLAGKPVVVASIAKCWLFSQANHPLSSRGYVLPWCVAAQPGDANWFVSLIPCEQSKNIERLRMNEVSGQFFSKKLVRCHVNAALEPCLCKRPSSVCTT